MPAPSTSSGPALVLDTSAIINLNASGCARDILVALPRPALVVGAVLDDLDRDGSRGRGDAMAAAEPIAVGALTVSGLGDAGLTYFESLVVGPAVETLDDGEAAVIARAAETGAVAVIDDRKAIAICKRRHPAVDLLSSADLFADIAVQAALGEQRLVEAVFNALQRGRMRVLPHRLDWVVGLIGKDRARLCRSLPASART